MSTDTTKKNWIVPLVVALAVAAIGLICWIVQLTQGQTVLGVGHAVAWGVYIPAFFLLAGTGSGLLIFAGLIDFGLLKGLEDIRKGLLCAAIGCFVAAAFMIVVDLGRPERVFNMLLYMNLSSMFVWDFWFLTLSIVLAVIMLVMKKENKVLAGIAILAATALMIAEGWILSVTPGNPLWETSLIPVLFFVEGIIAALAAILLLNRIGEGMATPIRILAAVLPAILIFNLVEAISLGYLGSSEAAEHFAVLSGDLGVFYWSQMIVGVVVPFFMLLFLNKNAMMIKIAAGLVFLGILVAKILLVVAGQAVTFTGTVESYAPSMVELGGVLGALGIAVFLFILLKNILPSGKAA